MSDPQCTPTPWFQSHRQRADGNYATEIYDQSGETIATVSWYPVKTIDGGTISLREVHAHNIVHCVNVHDELVEALEACVKVLGYADANLPECPHKVAWRNGIAALKKEKGQ
jgi:hypothetical protein